MGKWGRGGLGGKGRREGGKGRCIHQEPLLATILVHHPTNSFSFSFHPFSPTIRYSDDISLEDAIHTALLTLKESFEGEMTEKTIEIGVVTNPTAEEMVHKSGERLPATFRKLSQQEVKDYLAL